MRRSIRGPCRLPMCALLVLVACLDSPTEPWRLWPPAAIVIVSGNDQSAPAGEELPQPVLVRVTDRHGAPLADIRVHFEVQAGGGRMRSEYVNSSETGIAAAHWVLGTSVAERQQLVALVPVESGSTISAVITATARPGAASQLVMLGGNRQVGMLGEVLPESLAVRVADRYGNGVPGITVTWSASGAGEGVVSARSNTSDTSGEAKAAWTLGTRLDVPQVVTVGAAGLPPLMFTADATVPPTARLELVAGDAQRAVVGTALAESLAVRLTLASSAPVPGATVLWAVSAGAGTIAPLASATDEAGIAKAEWVLGASVLPGSVTATVSGLTPVTFSAQALADAPVSLEKVAGDDQHGVPGQFALDSLVVQLRDRHGNPVPDAAVAFAVTGGNGAVAPATAATGADGRAATRLRLGDAGSVNAVTATGGDGLSATFRVDGTPGSDWQLRVIAGSGHSVATGEIIADVRVRLSDGLDRPLGGATVTWAAADGGRADYATTFTGADGIASNSWTVGCGLRTFVLTANVAGTPSATLTATTTSYMPPWSAGASGLPPGAPVYSTLGFVTAVTDASGCPVSGVGIPFVALPDASYQPTGLAATGGVTDDAGLAASSVTLGGYVGEQCAMMQFHPPYESFFCIAATAPSYSVFRISADSTDIHAGSTMLVRLDARDAEGRPVWGARWRVLDTDILDWVSYPDYAANLYAIREGTGRVVATLGDRSDTAFVRVEPAAIGSMAPLPQRMNTAWPRGRGAHSRSTSFTRDTRGRPARSTDASSAGSSGAGFPQASSIATPRTRRSRTSDP